VKRTWAILLSSAQGDKVRNRHYCPGLLKVGRYQVWVSKLIKQLESFASRKYVRTVLTVQTPWRISVRTYFELSSSWFRTLEPFGWKSAWGYESWYEKVIKILGLA